MSRGAFADTGLVEPLSGAAAALGWDAPTPLQEAAIPVIRRGGNAVLRGSSGAGVTFAWAAGLLERVAAFDTDGGPRALILCPSTERAARLADALARIAALATGEEGAVWRQLRIRALATGWAADRADVLVSGTAAAANEVAGARLKLDTVGALVLESAHELIAGSRDALEALLAAVSRDAQRVIVTAAVTDELEAFIESNARRALTIPPRPHEGAAEPEPSRAVTVLMTAEADKLDALCAVLADRDAGREVVLARSRARAANLAMALDRRGLGSSEGGPAVETWSGDDRGTIAWDVPFDAAGFDRLAGDAPLVLVTPAERAHLRSAARQAGVDLVTRTAARPRAAAAAWRTRIERAIEDEDIDAQLALLQPLLERHAAEEVAAALSALLRRKSPEPGNQPRPATAGAPPPPSFVRLFFSAGQRDGLRPADLVGAITGETGVPGDRIGRIDIRDTFTVAEVDTAAADAVIRALNGTTLRGRSIRVDYDRRSTPGAVRRSRPPRPGP